MMNNEFSVALGKYCAEIRRSTGYSQADVAKECGCTKANVSAFERGLNRNTSIFGWYVYYCSFNYDQFLERLNYEDI